MAIREMNVSYLYYIPHCPECGWTSRRTQIHRRAIASEARHMRSKEHKARRASSSETSPQTEPRSQE